MWRLRAPSERSIRHAWLLDQIIEAPSSCGGARPTPIASTWCSARRRHAERSEFRCLFASGSLDLEDVARFVGHNNPKASAGSRVRPGRERPRTYANNSTVSDRAPRTSGAPTNHPPCRFQSGVRRLARERSGRVRQHVLTLIPFVATLEKWTSRRALASTVSPTTTCSTPFDITGEPSRLTMTRSRCSSARRRALSRWRSVSSPTTTALR